MANRVQIIFDALNRSEGAFKSIQDDMKGIGAAVGRVNAALKGLGLGFGGLAMGQVAKDIFDAGLAAERMTNALKAATGSSKAAGDEFQFIRTEASRLGLDLQTSAQGFTQLAASAKGTALSGQAVRNIFTGISEASTVLGLSAYDTEGAIRAVGQMMSKGTVQAEELRGQLGERIPGAFQIAARAMGVSTQELGKMLEQGRVISEEFLPKFATELRKTFADALPDAVRSAQANLNRFRTELFDLEVEIARGGFMAGAVAGIEGLSEAFRGLNYVIKDLGAAISETPGLKELQAFLSWLEEHPQAFAALPGGWGKSMYELLQQYGEVRERQERLKGDQAGQRFPIPEPPKPNERRETEEERRTRGKLADSWRQTKADLALDVEKLGLNQFDAKIADINARAAELTEKFGNLGEIEGWRKNLIGAVELEREMSQISEETANLEAGLDGALEAFQGFSMGLMLAEDPMAQITEGLTLYDEKIEASKEKSQEVFGQINEFGIQAARNIQSAFADFLFDPFADGLDGMLENFANTLRRMAAEAASKQILTALFDGLASSGNPVASWMGVFFGGVKKHEGGPILRYHEGGQVLVPRFHFGGLLPDEVPAVLQTGERVLSREQNKTFERLAETLNRASAGAGTGGGVEINVYNQAGVDVSMNQKQGPGQKEILEIFIQAAAKNINLGGVLDRTISRTYGINRLGVR